VSRTTVAYVEWYGKSRHQDWGTPVALFADLHSEYEFDLDGAADDGNRLLPDASTPEEPKPWTGRRVFCNPPWSNIPPFIEEAAKADLAVLLVPARTNARWFHRALALGARVRYFLGRPAFVNAKHDGNGHNSPVDCVLLVFGGDRVAALSEARARPSRVRRPAHAPSAQSGAVVELVRQGAA